MPAVDNTMSRLLRTKPAVSPYTKSSLVSSQPASIASSTTDREDEVASSPGRPGPPVPVKRGRGRPSKVTLAAEAAFAQALKDYASGSEEPEEAYRREKVAAGGFYANSPGKKTLSKLSGAPRSESASTDASGASEMDAEDSAAHDILPPSTRSSPPPLSETTASHTDLTSLFNIPEATRHPSEAPSNGSTESSAPVTRVVPRRKPVGRPPGITAHKKQPAGAALAAAAAKKAAAKRKHRALAAIEPNLEILVHNDPSIDLLVSYLSSPFAGPLPLRPVSIMRSSTSSSSYTSYLFAVPKGKDNARGVVNVGLSSEVIEVPASTEAGFGGERLALVVKSGEAKWVTAQ